MKIPYGKQLIEEDDIAAVVATLRSDFLTQGPKVLEFEQAFAHYVGAKYAIAVTNGTAALHLCAMAMGLKAGQKVLTTPITFVATANCVLYCGGEVEFVDIDEKNFCLDLNLLEKKLASAPKGTYSGIIPVDFAGYPVNMEKLLEIAKKYNLWVIEDGCHAVGAAFKNSRGAFKKVGANSHATVFSFHPVKHIACGEGGMITTNDEKTYQTLMRLRTHGITKNPADMTKIDGGWYHEMQDLGFNYRISDILCALGLSQLKKLDANLERRQEIAKRYRTELADLPVKMQADTDVYNAYHLFVIRTDRRVELYEFLKEHDVLTQVHYIPVYQQPYYQSLGFKEKLAVAEKYYAECLSIPMYHGLSDEEQTGVINLLKQFFHVKK